MISGSHGFYNLGQEILIIHAMISTIPTISTIFMIILFIYLHWKVSVDNRKCFFSSDLSAVQPIYVFVEDNYDLARPVSLSVWKYGGDLAFGQLHWKIKNIHTTCLGIWWPKQD